MFVATEPTDAYAAASSGATVAIWPGGSAGGSRQVVMVPAAMRLVVLWVPITQLALERAMLGSCFKRRGVCFMQGFSTCAEWEGLQSELTIERVEECVLIPDNGRQTARLSITRGDDYELKGVIRGTGRASLDKPGLPGTRVHPSRIMGSACHGTITCIVDNVYANHLTHTYDQDSRPTFEMEIRPLGVTSKLQSQATIAWQTYWYINGPTNDTGWPPCE